MHAVCVQGDSSSLSGSMMHASSPLAQGRRRELATSHNGSRGRRSSLNHSSSEMMSALSPRLDSAAMRQAQVMHVAGGAQHAAQHAAQHVPSQMAISQGAFAAQPNIADVYWSGTMSGTMTESVYGSTQLGAEGGHHSYRGEHGWRSRRHSGSTDVYGRPVPAAATAGVMPDQRPPRQSESWDPFFRESDAELLSDGDRTATLGHGSAHMLSDGSPVVSGGLQHMYRYLDGEDGSRGGDPRPAFLSCAPRWQRQSALTMPARIGEDGSMDSSGAVSEASGPRTRRPCLSVPGSSMGADRWGHPEQQGAADWGNVEDVSEELPNDATVSRNIGGGDAFMDSLLLLPEGPNAGGLR